MLSCVSGTSRYYEKRVLAIGGKVVSTPTCVDADATAAPNRTVELEGYIHRPQTNFSCCVGARMMIRNDSRKQRAVFAQKRIVETNAIAKIV
jgi:hypothetical protein